MRTADNFAVRIGQDELGRIFRLRENLGYSENLARQATVYADLGWRLAALDAQGSPYPGIDLQQPAEVWSKPLTDAIMNGARINLAVLAGKVSNLLVVELDPKTLPVPEAETWGTPCIARAGGRERHFFTLPPGAPPFPSGQLAAGQLKIYGEGGRVAAPPSLDDHGGEPWEWLESPAEAPPQPPGPAVWDLLQQHLDAESPEEPEPEIIPWERLYSSLASHASVLQAFLCPAPTADEYYRTLLGAARQAGLREMEVLLSLLWHAPQGEARSSPERWEWLRELAARPEGGKLEAVGSGGGAWYRGLRAALAGARRCSEPESRTEPGLASGKGDLGLSQQVLKPLAELRQILGDKIPAESQLYEAVSQEMERITGKAKVLEERLSRWEQHFQEPAAPAAEPPKGEAGEKEEAPFTSNRFNESSGGKATAHKAKEAEAQEATKDFLEKNQDLAGDPDKVEMVDFCLKNYVNINPSLASLPFREKLERAGQMAREFLGV